MLMLIRCHNKNSSQNLYIYIFQLVLLYQYVCWEECEIEVEVGDVNRKSGNPFTKDGSPQVYYIFKPPQHPLNLWV